MIKAIETVYNGYRFRSRLEARWAVFFDALGVEWQYEPEGFDLDGIWYLPDFWLHNPGCWIEIKPELPTGEEQEKAGLLAMHSRKWVNMFCGSPYPDSFKVVTFRHQYPNDDLAKYLDKAIEEGDERLFRILLYSNHHSYLEDFKQKAIERGFDGIHLNLYTSRYLVLYDRNLCYCPYHKSISFGHTFFVPQIHQCPKCGEAHEYINNDAEPIIHGRCFKCEDSLDSKIDYSQQSIDNQFLRFAYTSARQARFEHGQNGLR